MPYAQAALQVLKACMCHVVWRGGGERSPKFWSAGDVEHQHCGMRHAIMDSQSIFNAVKSVCVLFSVMRRSFAFMSAMP
jgi:hypothetical protein